jgi:hypothetical protein
VIPDGLIVFENVHGETGPVTVFFDPRYSPRIQVSNQNQPAHELR